MKQHNKNGILFSIEYIDRLDDVRDDLRGLANILEIAAPHDDERLTQITQYTSRRLTDLFQDMLKISEELYILLRTAHRSTK